MLELEANLIKQAKKGDSDAFGQLYDHYLPKIYRYILLKVSHREEAEDLTHEVFVSAWENIDSYKSQGFPFSTWLYHIAKNKVIDFYRTHKTHLALDAVDESWFKVAGAIEHQTDVAISFAKIKSAMSKLSDDAQDVLIMRFVDDLSHKEIAQALQKSEGAVRLIQHRALQQLKELLE